MTTSPASGAPAPGGGGGLTLGMSGGCQMTKPAGGRPLDGEVRRLATRARYATTVLRRRSRVSCAGGERQ